MTILQAITHESLLLTIAAALMGLVVGSFLNILTRRILSQNALAVSGSYCNRCHHQRRASELIAVLAFMRHKGRCMHCGARLAWYYPLVEVLTASCFVIVLAYFGLTPYAFGMMIFVSALIAVTITDFKEKLIPHEITYPAILLGIIFSVIVRQDTLGTLAGIGVSYILFDFLAFYGLKVYLHINKPQWHIGEMRPKALETAVLPAKPLSKDYTGDMSMLSRDHIRRPLKRIDEKIKESIQVLSNGQPVHEIEVMGGGDAVLSALIAAWLGLPRLINALLIGFLIGTFMGAIYFVAELHKQRLLNGLVRPVSIGIVCGVALASGFLAIVAHLVQQPYQSMPWLPFLTVGCLGGLLLGVLASGSRVSKPFPFGPALAGGAAVALFSNPSNNFGLGGT